MKTPWQNDWIELEEIGRGGQGIVTKLEAKSDKEKLAVLKRIVPRWANNSEAKKRLENEAEALIKLGRQDARVPMVYDSFLDHENSEPFLLMEYIEGARFDKWLDSNAPAPLEDAVSITLALSETIELCHSLNIGHRDLKPANIILKDSKISEPYILDFGISFDSRQSYILTKHGEIFWNEFLTLPECQDQQGGHQDLRTDITALVGIFFSCLTGRPPIVLRDAQDIQPHRRADCDLAAVIKSPGMMEKIRWLFDRGFSYRIVDRFQNMKEFKGELLRVSNVGEQVKFDLNEQLNKLEKAAMARRRPIQLEYLRDKLAPIEQTLYTSIQKELQGMINNKSRMQASSVLAGVFNEAGRLPGNGYDLLNTNYNSFTISRNHLANHVVMLVAFFGYGMQIHLFATTYISGLVKDTKDLILDWHKIAVIYENEETLSDDTMPMIVDEVKNLLAIEVGNITDLEIRGE